MSSALKLEQALELWEDGVQMMRERLRRQFSDESAEQIETRLASWLAGPEPLPDPERRIGRWPRNR